MQAIDRPYVTEAAFLALPETHQRLELLDGEVVVSPSVTWRHQAVLQGLFEQLRGWARQRAAEGEAWTVALAPLDVRFGPDRILQPDLVVFPGRLPLDAPMPIDRGPVLCVEVLSTDTTWDRHTKRLVYAEAGVPEYWVVDPHGGAERFSGPGLKQRAATADRLEALTLPGLAVDVADPAR